MKRKRKLYKRHTIILHAAHNRNPTKRGRRRARKMLRRMTTGPILKARVKVEHSPDKKTWLHYATIAGRTLGHAFHVARHVAQQAHAAYKSHYVRAKTA